MSNSTVHQQESLRHTQDCVTVLRRWLATGNNTAALMAYLHHEPVDPTWLTTYRRLSRDLRLSVGNARPDGVPGDP
ncbi:hypothetical protein EEB14_24810 [Rhodococcus sp. WS4]|nr:hypothetical protein EEB14_24810 [Rhodococcus sp. WS4]